MASSMADPTFVESQSQILTGNPIQSIQQSIALLLSYKFIYNLLTYTHACESNRVKNPTRQLGRSASHDLVWPKFPNNLGGPKAIFVYVKSTVESA